MKTRRQNRLINYLDLAGSGFSERLKMSWKVRIIVCKVHLIPRGYGAMFKSLISAKALGHFGNELQRAEGSTV